MQWLTSQPIAHRGLHKGPTIPENSLAAFEAAIHHHHPIELDIQFMSDDNIAVFHDDNLERITGVKGKISEQTAETIKKLRLLDTNQFIPLLEDALSLIDGKVPILVEIKNTGSAGKFEQVLLKKLQFYRGELAIQSFNPYSLAWFVKNAPHITRGQLSTNFYNQPLPWYNQVLLTNLMFNWLSKPNFIAYDIRFLPNIPTQIAKHIFSLPIIAWTIRSEAELTQSRQYADNVIFEYINLKN